MANNEYLKAVIKNNVMDYGAQSVPSVCSSSKNSSIGDFEDIDSAHTMGLRSPTAPLRGRSVKEVEEQLSNLKKENFNLKLRIYFLEEKLGINFTLDKDNVVKKNIELQIEVANLQKDIKEKHELLCQAVKAMEIEDEERKKYSQNKEDQIAQLQQEIEDLRLQLHDTSRYDSGLTSVMSNHTTSFSSKRPSNTRIAELEERAKILECELQIERENNASLQLVIDQAQSLKNRCELLQKENESKGHTINTLNDDISAATQRLIEFAEQVKEYERKLAVSHQDNQNLVKKMQANHKKLEDLCSQVGELTNKLNGTKYEFEKELKRADRNKTINEMKITELENSNDSLKLTLHELQNKLDAATIESKKHQNLAVSKSPEQQLIPSYTDNRFISVTHSATSDGVAKTDPLHVPIANSRRRTNSPEHLSVILDTRGTPTLPNPLSPRSPDLSSFDFERDSGDSNKLLDELRLLKSHCSDQKQKIVKLKSEQFKACEIIKQMIETRNKTNQELEELRRTKEEMERELETTVSKEEKNERRSLKDRVSELNIRASTVSTPPCENSMDQTSSEDKELAEQYKALTEELETKVEVLVETLNEKDIQLQQIRNQYDEILTVLVEKENKIVDLEFELLSYHQDNSVVPEKSDSGSEKHSSFYKQEIDAKNVEIERLNVELKKCTCYLQEIVNKELWDKNKEIEKLHLKHDKASEVNKLRKEVATKDMQLAILKEKISELGLNIELPQDGSKVFPSPTRNIEDIKALQEQLKCAIADREYFERKVNEIESNVAKSSGDSNENTLEILKTEKENLAAELENSEILRMQTNEVCSVLGTRLEELAIFLDSLLKQKSVLGFLGIAKNKRLREMIDNSLDLSRSFTMSMLVNPEQSLVQLTNISEILNGSVFKDLSLRDVQEDENDGDVSLSIIPSNVTLTYQSHLRRKCSSEEPNKEQVIVALREQVVALKSELQLRDTELNKLDTKAIASGTDENHIDMTTTTGDLSQLQCSPNKCNTSTTLNYQSQVHSESEAWSEPDRAVSRARIGLNRTVPGATKSSRKLYSNDSTEDDIVPSTSKRQYSAYQLHHQIQELEEEVARKSAELSRVSEQQNVRYLQELEKELNDTKEQLTQTEIFKSMAEEKCSSLQKTVNELLQIRKDYEQDLVVKDKEMQNKINAMEIDKANAIRDSNEYKQQVVVASDEITKLKQKLEIISKEMQVFEENLRKEYETMALNKVTEVEADFLTRLAAVEESSRKEVNNYKNQLEQIREDYSMNYVDKREMERLVADLNELKSTVTAYQETIESYRTKEREIHDTLQRYQEQTHTLGKELDNTALQYSESFLEKTKISNEKTLLEQELKRQNQKENDLKQQFANFQSEFSLITENYQEKLDGMQKQKSKLEVKVSELESANAELHNRLIRIQVSNHELNSSMPNIASCTLPVSIYKRQFSDQASYNSSADEDNRPGFHFKFNCSRQQQFVVNPVEAAAGEAERHEANSSPDLGIESDHGRLSSLETQAQQLPRPLQHTVDLTQSMNNLLERELNLIEDTKCGNDYCCKKSVEIIQENNELKRKLHRMNRALEETAYQLNMANQRKKQVEKTICKQIHKTSQVLRKVKANLDSGSESDLFNKM